MECVEFNHRDGRRADGFEPRGAIAQRLDMAAAAPSQAAFGQYADPSAVLPAGVAVGASFPKVLRLRLDRFFADRKISPKADAMMWSKIAIGLAVLAGSFTAIYLFRPGSWTFVVLYVLGGLAQTFLMLNIAHDSNHNAISSRPFVNKTLN
jgi:linoleoyl-CoA desaturase